MTLAVAEALNPNKPNQTFPISVNSVPGSVPFKSTVIKNEETIHFVSDVHGQMWF